MTPMTLRSAWLGASLLLLLEGCSVVPTQDPAATAALVARDDNLPSSYALERDGDQGGELPWRQFFADDALKSLIETALANNQEQQILLAELEISRNEAYARSGEYLPSAALRAGVGREKPGQYTRNGAVEEQLDLREGRPFPEPLPDYLVGIDVSWEVDIWHRLRDAQKSAVLRYLATAEGRRFAQTHLVAEIASSYYELVALDRKEAIIRQMIDIQQSALRAVQMQKQAGEATELVVRRFEAELQKNRAELFQLHQDIRETENRINFLAGRFPTAVERGAGILSTGVLAQIGSGTPAALLAQRPDIRRAEHALAAAQLDVNVARARFYPSLSLDASLGYSSAEAGLLLETPESLAYGIAADLFMPLLNRRGIRAAYNGASARQEQALVDYQQTVLKAFIEVSNQLSALENLASSIDSKRQQAGALSESIDIATRLYRSARADYTEVLLTQRDALEAQMELVELEQQQIAAMVRMYQLLGGGTEDPVPEAG